MRELLIMKPYRMVNMLFFIYLILVLIKKEPEKSVPSHSGIFVLPPSERLMNKFVNELIRFYSIEVYFQDIDSLYIYMDDYEKLKEAGYVGNNLVQG